MKRSTILVKSCCSSESSKFIWSPDFRIDPIARMLSRFRVLNLKQFLRPMPPINFSRTRVEIHSVDGLIMGALITGFCQLFDFSENLVYNLVI